MPLITRTLKGSKLSIEEMDGNLTYLESLATSTLRDYVQLLNKPLVIDNFDRWNTTKEFKSDNFHFYIDGPFSLRFTNQVNEGGPNYLMRAWDWDGPLSQPFTPYQNEEVVYNERAQISFLMEDPEKSSLSLKSYDWTLGTQSGVEFDYKFYQGAFKLPINTVDPESTDGSLAFSDGTSWDPDSVGGPALNIRLNGEWKQVNLGAGVTGPQGPTGAFGITNPGQYKLTTSDGSEGGIKAEDNLTFDGATLSVYGDLKVWGVIDQPTLKSPTLNTPSLSYGTLQGDTTLQNITTVLVDSVLIDQSVVNFDFALGSVFYVSNPLNDFTINVTNLPTTDSRTINITLFVDQQLTSFGIVDFQINGVSQTIKWIGGVPPTIVVSTVTAYTFNLLRSGNTWLQVLGGGGVYA